MGQQIHWRGKIDSSRVQSESAPCFPGTGLSMCCAFNQVLPSTNNLTNASKGRRLWNFYLRQIDVKQFKEKNLIPYPSFLKMAFLTQNALRSPATPPLPLLMPTARILRCSVSPKLTLSTSASLSKQTHRPPGTSIQIKSSALTGTSRQMTFIFRYL